MVSLEFFIDIILPALGSSQPLTEMSNRNIFPGGKGGRCVGLTTLPPLCDDCLEIWEPQPPGTLRACQGLQWDCFLLYLNATSIITRRFYHLYFKVLSTTNVGYHKFIHSFILTHQARKNRAIMTCVCRNMQQLLSEVTKLSIIEFDVYL
jgi:hypothetical protein